VAHLFHWIITVFHHSKLAHLSSPGRCLKIQTRYMSSSCIHNHARIATPLLHYFSLGGIPSVASVVRCDLQAWLCKPTQHVGHKSYCSRLTGNFWTTHAVTCVAEATLRRSPIAQEWQRGDGFREGLRRQDTSFYPDGTLKIVPK
jgi:hypothetical protein